MGARAYWAGWANWQPGLKSKGELKTDLNCKFEVISDFGKTLKIYTT
jgi:hypothetical protein